VDTTLYLSIKGRKGFGKMKRGKPQRKMEKMFLVRSFNFKKKTGKEPGKKKLPRVPDRQR